jgi:AraC-like DNA-binding protein
MAARHSTLPTVRSVGISIWDPIWAQREHIGEHTELVHILRGTVLLVAGTERYRGGPGDTLLIPAGTPHRDAFPAGSTFEVLHVLFDWPAGLAHVKPAINRDLVRFSAADKLGIKRLMTDVHDDFRRAMDLAPAMSGASLYRVILFLVSACRSLHARPSRREQAAGALRRQALVERARQFMRDNLHQPVSLALIARHLGLSAFHLSHIFSQESGFTLSSYLQHERMRKAAELLADPTRQVAQIAYAVGFEDANYFGKAFRKHFGESPGSFRDRLLARERKVSP